MSVIMIIMAQFDGHPIPKCSYGLTLNAVVSILAVIARSSLVLPLAEALSQVKWRWFWSRQRPIIDFETFDLASRGPWGSPSMLLNVRMWNIGSLGAFLTLSALAVEPWLQQIPAYTSRNKISDTAFIPRSLHYVDRQTDFGSAKNAMSASVKAAFYIGIFSSTQTKESIVGPTCSTGNCTWPEYSSVGVCSACEDVMGAIKFAGSKDGSEWVPPYPFNDSDTTPVPGAYWTMMYMYASTEAESSYPFKPVQNHTILDTISLYWPPGVTPHNAELLSPKFNRAAATPPSGVFECILYFCVKTYSAHMHNGEFKETVISTWPGANESLSHDIHLPSNLHKSLNVNMTLRPPGQDQSFTIDLYTLATIRNWINETFRISILADYARQISPYFETTTNEGQDIAQAFFNDQTRTLGSKRTVFNYTVPTTAGPKPLLDEIAKSMTTYIRDIGRPDMAATGSAHTEQIVVKVRWYWAIFPVVVLVLTFCFTISTIALSLMRGVPIWKSSSLATLLHGLDKTFCETLTAKRLDNMEINAEDHVMRMQSEAESGRWRLEGSVKST